MLRGCPSALLLRDRGQVRLNSFHREAGTWIESLFSLFVLIYEFLKVPPSPNLDAKLSSLFALGFCQLPSKLIQHPVVVRSGDNNVFNDGRTVLKSFLDLIPSFLCCQLSCWLLFLALDADGTFEILFSVADKVDTELLLARPPLTS